MRRREVARLGARGAASRRQAEQRPNLVQHEPEVAGAADEGKRRDAVIIVVAVAAAAIGPR